MHWLGMMYEFLYIYNNIAKIIALLLLQREQASLILRMVHRDLLHMLIPPPYFMGYYFSTLGFSYREWIIKSLHHTTIFLISHFLIFLIFLSSLISWVTYSLKSLSC